MKTIEITEENLQKAHKETCTEGKTLLEDMFPEVFESKKSKYFDLTKLQVERKMIDRVIFTYASAINAGFGGEYFLKIKSGGQYANKAFFLTSDCDWRIEKDDTGLSCLIPTKK